MFTQWHDGERWRHDRSPLGQPYGAGLAEFAGRVTLITTIVMHSVIQIIREASAPHQRFVCDQDGANLFDPSSTTVVESSH